VSQRLVRLAARQMKAQVPDAWPNLFREARFLSAVDFVQSDRPRRRGAGEMARIFGEVDLLLVPSLCDAHRAPVRRGYNRPCGRSDGARVGRVHERPAGF
jgi:hypothetical protein